MARGYRPGGLAKSLLRGVGDVDVAVAGAETRHAVLSEMTSKDVQQIKASADNALIAVEQQVKDVNTELQLIEVDHRAKKAEPLRHRIEQAAAWRSAGIEERIPNLILPGLARAALLALLAALDFYIFAQAYAAADGSIRDYHDPRWWLGGMLGLCVFVAGVVFTHGLKNLIAARAQRELLREADQDQLKIDPAVREKLVTIKSPLPALFGSGAIFAVLLWAGFELRLQGAATSDLVVTVFQSLIPLVGVAAELYLFDPFHRVPPGFGRRHRELRRKLARLEHQLEGVQRKRDHLIEGIERHYGVEHAVLDVEQKDMGLKPTAPEPTPHP
jgi:hypothetical protein